VHEATFLHEEAERARQTSHSTARQAAELARDADVRLLALTHISSRYGGRELREEARATFAATELARDFDTIDVPFPERGGAALERWSDRVARERAQAEGGAASSEPAASASGEPQPSSRAADPREPVASP
jgi:ribonuclease Z